MFSRYYISQSYLWLDIIRYTCIKLYLTLSSILIKYSVNVFILYSESISFLTLSILYFYSCIVVLIITHSKLSRKSLHTLQGYHLLDIWNILAVNLMIHNTKVMFMTLSKQDWKTRYIYYSYYHKYKILKQQFISEAIASITSSMDFLCQYFHYSVCQAMSSWGLNEFRLYICKFLVYTFYSLKVSRIVDVLC